jgi:hypothetical protein
LDPTRAFIRVDLPTFGRPAKQAKPDLKLVFAVLAFGVLAFGGIRSVPALVVPTLVVPTLVIVP